MHSKTGNGSPSSTWRDGDDSGNYSPTDNKKREGKRQRSSSCDAGEVDRAGKRARVGTGIETERLDGEDQASCPGDESSSFLASLPVFRAGFDREDAIEVDGDGQRGEDTGINQAGIVAVKEEKEGSSAGHASDIRGGNKAGEHASPGIKKEDALEITPEASPNGGGEQSNGSIPGDINVSGKENAEKQPDGQSLEDQNDQGEAEALNDSPSKEVTEDSSLEASKATGPEKTPVDDHFNENSHVPKTVNQGQKEFRETGQPLVEPEVETNADPGSQDRAEVVGERIETSQEAAADSTIPNEERTGEEPETLPYRGTGSQPFSPDDLPFRDDERQKDSEMDAPREPQPDTPEATEQATIEKCSWCEDFAYGLVGFNSHKPGQMCTACAKTRASITSCPGHQTTPLKDLDPASFDFKKAYDSLAPIYGNRVDSYRWCSLCPTPAFFRCGTQVVTGDEPPAGSGPGCGLLLCEPCNIIIHAVRDLSLVVERNQQDDAVDGSRADVGYLLPGSVLPERA